MVAVLADKLGYCWDVNANGTYSTLTNWARYETLVDMHCDQMIISGAGASQVAAAPKQNAGSIRPCDISYLAYTGSATMAVNGTVHSNDGRADLVITSNASGDVLRIPLPRAITLGIGERIRAYMRIRLSTTSGTNGVSFGFLGANHSIAYALITVATTGTDDKFMTVANSRLMGSGGTQVGTDWDFGVGFGTGPRMMVLELTRTGASTYTIRLNNNHDGTGNTQTGLTTFNIENITDIGLRNEGSATINIDWVKVLYFPATIQKSQVPNWADAEVSFAANISTQRTITIDAAYTMGAFFASYGYTYSGAGSITLQSATNSEVSLDVLAAFGATNWNIPLTAKKRLRFHTSPTGAVQFNFRAGITLEAGAEFSGLATNSNAQIYSHTSGNSWTGDIDVTTAVLGIRDNACFTNAKTWTIGTVPQSTPQGARLRLGGAAGDIITVASNQSLRFYGGGNINIDVTLGTFGTVNSPIQVTDCLSTNRAALAFVNAGSEMYPFIMSGNISGPPVASTAVRFMLSSGNTGGWNRRHELSGTISNGTAGSLMLVVELNNVGTYTSPSPIWGFARITNNNTHTGGGAVQFGYGTGPTCVTYGIALIEHANALGTGVVQLNRSTGGQPQGVVSAVLTNAAITIANNFGVTIGSSGGFGGAFPEIGGYGAFASGMSGNVLLRGSNVGGIATLGPTHTGFRIRQNGNIVKDITMSAVGSSYTTPTTTFSTAIGGRTAVGTAVVRSGGIRCVVLQDPGEYPDGSTPTITFGSPGSGATTTVTTTGLGGVFTYSGTILQDTLLGSCNVAMIGTGVKRLTNAGSTFTGRFICREGTTVIGVAVASSGDSAVGNSTAGDIFINDVRTAFTSVRILCNQAPGTYNAAGGAGGTGQFTSTGTSYDSLTPATNDRILVMGCNDPRQNGIYVVTATTTTWDRASDLDANGELAHGIYVDVTAGTKYAGTRWVLDSYPTTLNSSANGGIGILAWEQEYAPLSAPKLLLDSGVTFARNITVNSYGGFGGVVGVYDTSSVTYSGTITQLAALTLESASSGTATFSGTISGAFSLTKTGAGTAIISGTASGQTLLDVAAGTLDITGTVTVG